MPTIVIRLDPATLTNPDTDLRYEIPDLLVERSGGVIADDGYDYEPEGAMQIYLSTADVDRAMTWVTELLEGPPLHDNRLAASATVGVSDLDASEVLAFTVVYPPGASGIIPCPEARKR